MRFKQYTKCINFTACFPLFRVFSRQKIHFKPSIYRAGGIYDIQYIVTISRYNTIYCSVLFCFVSFSAFTILHIVYIVMVLSICCVNITFIFVCFVVWQWFISSGCGSCPQMSPCPQMSADLSSLQAADPVRVFFFAYNRKEKYFLKITQKSIDKIFMLVYHCINNKNNNTNKTGGKYNV